MRQKFRMRKKYFAVIALGHMMFYLMEKIKFRFSGVYVQQKKENLLEITLYIHFPNPTKSQNRIPHSVCFACDCDKKLLFS